MRNCIILGSGRSGTSMLAGTLASSGYFMGHGMLRASPTNPKGFFEDPGINTLNEDLLAPVLPSRPPLLGFLYRDRPVRRQFWLARVPVGTPIPCPEASAAQIRELTDHEPFCFKDPRFNYTLPAWRPFLRDTAFLVVFRPPAQTAQSILRECGRARYLRSLRMDFDRALQGWELMYRHILDVHRHAGDWLFLHFDQIVQGDRLDEVERLLDARVDRGFPDGGLRRSDSNQAVPSSVQATYDELCERAGYAATAC